MTAVHDNGWATDGITETVCWGNGSRAWRRCSAFTRDEVVPRLARTTDEIRNVLRALDGRSSNRARPDRRPAAWCRCCRTGRNFYSVDPKAIPSRNAFDVGSALRIPCWPGITRTPGNGRAASA
ncbi:hypothetical protein GCM10018954_072640 [Kutzneria kofuensis]